MANNSIIDAPVIVIGGAGVYSGNSFTKPFPKSFYPPDAGITPSLMEGAVDTLFGDDIVRASGSETADYTIATFFDVDDRLVPHDICRHTPWWSASHSFYPSIA